MANRRAGAALAGVALIWGATFVVVKRALDDASTLAFLAIRFSLAAAVLALVYRKRLKGWPSRGGLWAGLFLFAGYVFQTSGLRYTTPAKAAFITGLFVALVPLLYSVVYHMWPQLSELAGVWLAITGLWLLTQSPGRWELARGDLLVLGCSFCFATHTLVLAHFSRREGFEALAITQIATTALLAAASCGWAEKLFLRPTPELAGALGVTALGATALAFSVQTWAQGHIGPTQAALILSLEPVFAWITSYLVTGEVLTARATAGAGLILGGVVLVEMKPFGRAAHPS